MVDDMVGGGCIRRWSSGWTAIFLKKERSGGFQLFFFPVDADRKIFFQGEGWEPREKKICRTSSEAWTLGTQTKKNDSPIRPHSPHTHIHHPPPNYTHRPPIIATSLHPRPLTSYTSTAPPLTTLSPIAPITYSSSTTHTHHPHLHPLPSINPPTSIANHPSPTTHRHIHCPPPPSQTYLNHPPIPPYTHPLSPTIYPFPPFAHLHSGKKNPLGPESLREKKSSDQKRNNSSISHPHHLPLSPTTALTTPTFPEEFLSLSRIFSLPLWGKFSLPLK